MYALPARAEAPSRRSTRVPGPPDAARAARVGGACALLPGCALDAAPAAAGAAAADLVVADRPCALRAPAPPVDAIRVMLVDDHTLVRAGLRALIAAAPDVVLVGESGGGIEAVALAPSLEPDVVVMDLDMPAGDGIAATRGLLAGPGRRPRVLILTMHGEEARLHQAMDAGASGFLTKDAADHELVAAIRAVARGEVYVRPQATRLLAARARDHRRPAAAGRREALALLSDRERSVVQLVAEGYNGPEVGRQLGISAKTVDTYRQRIEEKLGLAHRTEYVRFALELDLLRR